MATKVGLGLKSIDISRRRVAISPIDFFTIFEFFFRISIFFLFLISKGVTELDVVDDGPKLGLMTSLEISPTLCYNISFCFWVHWIRWRGWDWSIQISRNTYFVLQHLIFFFGGTGLDGVDDRAGIDLFSYPTYFVVQHLQSIVSQYVNSPEYLHTCSFLQF